MVPGLYHAATGLDASMQRQEIIADNLAHLAVPGFRARGMAFESFDAALDRQNAALGNGAAGVRPAGEFVNFQQGAIRQTGSPYHLAIEGDGFFALEGPNGNVYTRNGTFHLGPDGRLLSDSNYAVVGAGGSLTIPQDARSVSIGRDGSVTADGLPVGQIQLTRFANPQRLTQVGPTLFEAPPEADARPGEASILQGALESANTTPASAMVEMIQAARFFEAAQRALRSIAETLQLNTRPYN